MPKRPNLAEEELERALALINTPDGADDTQYGSDEENSYVAAIKSDVQRHLYETGEIPAEFLEVPLSEPNTENGKEVDPKVASGLRHIRKLDRVLARRLARERAVKTDRLTLHRQLRREIALIEAENPISGATSREACKNTSRFLSAVPPTSHSKGIQLEPDSGDEEDEEEIMSYQPFFATELNGDGSGLGSQAGNRSAGGVSGASSSTARSDDIHSSRNSELGSESLGSTRSRGSKRGGGAAGGFVARNKELARDAAASVPMTDEERKRVKALTADLDTFDVLDASDCAALVVATGEGFAVTRDDGRRLAEIDALLDGSEPPVHSGTSGAGYGSSLAGTSSILNDVREEREMSTRLANIDERLHDFQHPFAFERETPSLPPDELRRLVLDTASRLSISTPRDTPAGETAPDDYEALLQQAPPLTRDTLDDLLSEARQQLGIDWMYSAEPEETEVTVTLPQILDRSNNYGAGSVSPDENVDLSYDSTTSPELRNNNNTEALPPMTDSRLSSAASRSSFVLSSTPVLPEISSSPLIFQ